MTSHAIISPLQPPQTPEKLRIAVVSDAAPHRNGVGSYYQDLERYLDDYAAAQMVTFSPRINEGKWEGGIALPLPGDATQKVVFPSPYHLWRKLKVYKPDVVIVPTPGLYGIFGAIFGKRLNAKVIVGFHTWYEKLTELYWSHWQGKLTKGYFEFSNRILFKYADRVVANSEFMAETAASVGAPLTDLVGTPVDYDFIHKPVQAPSGRLQSILFAGRLAAEKNLESIIDAAENLPHIRFDIAGDGPEKDMIVAAQARLENLNYLGWMGREDLLKALDEHDMLVLPSHVESFGTVALEAMARKRLTLVSHHCGIAHWQSMQKGILHMGSDETLQMALRRIETMPADELQTIAGQAREAAMELNDWSLQQWRALLESTRNPDLPRPTCESPSQHP